MADRGRRDPDRTEEAGTAQAGTPARRSPNMRMGDERPDYDARQERIPEERRPAGPPLAEGERRPPLAFDGEEGEPPVDPDEE